MLISPRSGIFLALALAAPLSLPADTLHLRSGFRIHGKVNDSRTSEKQVSLDIEGVGSVTLPRGEVLAIEKNDRSGIAAAAATTEGEPHPALLRELVGARLKKGAGYYGRGPIYGLKSEDRDGKTIILELPGLGEIRLPKDAVEELVPAKLWEVARPAPAAFPAAPAPAATLAATPASASAAGGARTIRTTHIVRLKNGRKIPGTLVGGADASPLVLEVGSIGRVLIPRDRVAGIDAEASEIVLAASDEPAAPTGPEARGEPPAGPPSEPAPPATPEGGSTRPRMAEKGISDELREEIQLNIQELTRNRARNRVRAERALADIGAPAVPFLERIAQDPFDLTRRAVMRIVRDAGSANGIPIAIGALLDEDDFVRETAGEALRALTRQDLGYRPYASRERQIEAQRRWKEWWEEVSRKAAETR